MESLFSWNQGMRLRDHSASLMHAWDSLLSLLYAILVAFPLYMYIQMWHEAVKFRSRFSFPFATISAYEISMLQTYLLLSMQLHWTHIEFVVLVAIFMYLLVLCLRCYCRVFKISDCIDAWWFLSLLLLPYVFFLPFCWRNWCYCLNISLILNIGCGNNRNSNGNISSDCNNASVCVCIHKSENPLYLHKYMRMYMCMYVIACQMIEKHFPLNFPLNAVATRLLHASQCTYIHIFIHM